MEIKLNYRQAKILTKLMKQYESVQCYKGSISNTDGSSIEWEFNDEDSKDELIISIK